MRSSAEKLNSRRAGFTLVELLVAISIIVLLVALLMPAINATRVNARKAEVTVDIRALENALSEFKAEFNEYPPSRITLYPPGEPWDNRSRTIIRRYWPSFNFAASGGLSSTSVPAGGVTLNGAECLVFFLGGINDEGAPSGFSKNPATPFGPGGSRLGPFFEFDTGRLRDVTVDVDRGETENGFMEYLDPIPSQSRAYIYYSAYDGSGYDSADVNPKMLGTSNMPSFYMQSGSTAWKNQSFQIISPGFNGEFGEGGPYDPATADTVLAGTREAERDNITNFSDGTLAD